MKNSFIVAMVIMLAACNDRQQNSVQNNDRDSLQPAQDSVVVPVHEQHKDSSVMTKD